MTMVRVTIHKIYKNSFFFGIFLKVIPHFPPYLFGIQKRITIFCTPNKMGMYFSEWHNDTLLNQKNINAQAMIKPNFQTQKKTQTSFQMFGFFILYGFKNNHCQRWQTDFY